MRKGLMGGFMGQLVSAILWFASAALATWGSQRWAIGLLVVAAAALYRLEWFYPAFMIVLGAHYLPFVTLYGMKMFYALAALLVSAGVVLALYVTLPFSAGAWFTATVLAVFAFLGRTAALSRPTS